MESAALPRDLGEFLNGTSPAIAFSPDGAHLLTAHKDGTFSLWESADLRQGPRHSLPFGKIDLGTMAIANGGNLVAFTGRGGEVAFWTSDGVTTNTFTAIQKYRCTRATFSADGKQTAFGGPFGVVAYDVETKRELLTSISLNEGPVFSLRFSDDGTKLVAGFFSGIIKAWDMSAKTQEYRVTDHRNQVPDLLVLSDNETVVSMSRDIRFTKISPAMPLQSEILAPRPVIFRAAAVSRDGRRMAIGTSNGLITLWDLASKQEVLTIKAHRRGILKLAFLPDDETLISADPETLRIWRAPAHSESK